jgi:hypothetical protein
MGKGIKNRGTQVHHLKNKLNKLDAIEEVQIKYKTSIINENLILNDDASNINKYLD